MSSHEILFRERQRFTQMWLAAPFLASYVWLGWFAYNYPREESKLPLYLITAALIAAGCLVFYSALITEISPTGIFIQHKPFQVIPRYIRWDKVDRAEVCEYRSIPRGTSIYKTRKNSGLLLYLKDGKKVFIGTRKPQELRAVIVATGK